MPLPAEGVLTPVRYPLSADRLTPPLLAPGHGLDDSIEDGASPYGRSPIVEPALERVLTFPD